MVRRLALVAGLLALTFALSGCFSLNNDENIRMINHWGKSAHELRVLTNKYFYEFDAENPFED